LERILKNIRRTAMDDEQKGGKYLSSGNNRTGVSSPRPQQVRRPSFLSTSSGSTSKQSNLDTYSHVRSIQKMSFGFVLGD
jgi:hypothetical protein